MKSHLRIYCKTILLVAMYVLALPLCAQTPNWLWAANAGGSSEDYSYAVTMDKSANVYVTGYFYSSTMTVGSNVLKNAVSNEQTSDLFLMKYDASGIVQWAFALGGSEDDYGTALCTDDQGNIYLAGSFYSDSLHLGSYTLPNPTGSSFFLAKLDANGVAQWVITAHGDDMMEVHGIVCGKDGRVYATGSYGGEGIAFGTTKLSNIGGGDIVMLCCNASGNLQWLKTVGGSEKENATSLAIDPSENIIITGSFESPSLTVGTTTLNNAGGSDILLYSIDKFGIVQWATSYGGKGFESGTALCCDAQGNITLTGAFQSDSLELGTIVLKKKGEQGSDMFTARFTAKAQPQWAHAVGADAVERGEAICSDNLGNVYVCGSFTSSQLEIGDKSFSNLTVGLEDIVLVKYAADGTLEWATSVGAERADVPVGMSLNNDGSVVLTGGFASESLDFGSKSIQTTGDYDIFTATFNVPISSVEATTNAPTQTIRVAEQGLLHLQGVAGQSIHLYNLLGECLYSHTATEEELNIDMQQYTPGVYYYSIAKGQQNQKGTILLE